MQDLAQKLLQTLPDQPHAVAFAHRLLAWLIADSTTAASPAPDFSESRARALLRAVDLLDDPTRHSFTRLVENETAVRLALYDLLKTSELAQNDEVTALNATTAVSSAESITSHQAPIPWLALALAAFAWKSEYPLHQFDPAAPPDLYSPAGQVLKRTAHFVRQQVQRSATDRDKQGSKLAYSAAQTATPQLQNLQPQTPIAPVPPYYRSLIPVRYPEVARDTLHIKPEETEGGATAVVPPTSPTTTPLTITSRDLTPPEQPPLRMPPLRITTDQLPPERTPPRSPAPATPRPTPPAQPRRILGRSKEPLKTTKLRVVVQEYPDGPGLYGLQINVAAQGIRSSVAGTTNRDGSFLCELPVRAHSGLTYHVDVTWPREHGNETERKSITLHADRTQFVLPFYRRLSA